MLPYRQTQEEFRLLESPRQAPGGSRPGRGRRYVLPTQPYPPGVGAHESGTDAQKGRFSRSIGTHQPGDLSGGHFQRDIGECRQSPIANRDTRSCQGGRRRAR